MRIIAATHQNLEGLVAQGRFREDLFHRLNVIRIHIPALRERRQDIPLLLKHFLKEAGAELDVEPKVLRPEVMEYLSKQDWPGNVRQLENTCRWLTVMTTGQEVYLDDLPPELLQPKTATAGGGDGDWTDQLRGWAEARLRTGQINIAKDAIDTAESLLIETALEYTMAAARTRRSCWVTGAIPSPVKSRN